MSLVTTGAVGSNTGLLTRTRYENIIEKLFTDSSQAFSSVPVMKFSGQKVQWDLDVTHNSSIRGLDDQGSYGQPGRHKLIQASAGQRFISAKVGIGKVLEAVTASGQDVARSARSSEMQGVTKDIMTFASRMFFRDGSGSVAVVKDLGSDPDGIQVDDSTLLWRDSEYDLYDTTLATNRGTFTVERVKQATAALSAGATNFKFDAIAALPAGAAATDVIVWKNSLNKIPYGLDYLVDNAATTVQGIDCSDYEEYLSYVSSNGGTRRPLTLALFRETLAALKARGGNAASSSSVFNVAINPWQQKSLDESFDSNYWFSASEANGEKGWTVPVLNTSFGKIRMFQETDVQVDKVFIYEEGAVKRLETQGFKFETVGGEALVPSHDTANSTAVLTAIYNHVAMARQKCAKIEDLSFNAKVSSL